MIVMKKSIFMLTPRFKQFNLSGLLKRSLSSQINDGNICRSRIPSQPIPKVPLSNYIWDSNVNLHGDKIALVCKVCYVFYDL